MEPWQKKTSTTAKICIFIYLYCNMVLIILPLNKKIKIKPDWSHYVRCSVCSSKCAVLGKFTSQIAHNLLPPKTRHKQSKFIMQICKKKDHIIIIIKCTFCSGHCSHLNFEWKIWTKQKFLPLLLNLLKSVTFTRTKDWIVSVYQLLTSRSIKFYLARNKLY